MKDNNNINNNYQKSRICFLAGLVALSASLFFESYFFQAFDPSGAKIAHWSYSFAFGWRTPISSGAFNGLVAPNDLGFPFALNVVFLACVSVAFYLAVAKDIEGEDGLENLMYNAYANFFVLILSVFYLLIFPTTYLSPHNLYYPFVEFIDYRANAIFQYSLSVGYVLQLAGFFLTFPYTIFFYETVRNFEKRGSSSESMMEKYKEASQEDIDLEGLIAEEEFKKESRNSFANNDIVIEKGWVLE